MGRRLKCRGLKCVQSVRLEGGVGRDLGQQDTGQFCWQNLPLGASGVEAAMEHEVGGTVCVCV